MLSTGPLRASNGCTVAGSLIERCKKLHLMVPARRNFVQDRVRLLSPDTGARQREGIF
jgi:hypothetical protein